MESFPVYIDQDESLTCVSPPQVFSQQTEKTRTSQHLSLNAYTMQHPHSKTHYKTKQHHTSKHSPTWPAVQTHFSSRLNRKAFILESRGRVREMRGLKKRE